MNGNNQMMDRSEYTFTFNWNTPQSVISSSTYALAGYQMTFLNKYMSFDSFINQVSTTHMIFRFRPYASFFGARFYFVLFIPCSDQIVVK